MAMVTLACAGCMGAAIGPAVTLAAGFGVTEPHFQLGTCNNPECMYEKVESELSELHGTQHLAYTQAAGHPPYGVVGFEFNSETGDIGGAKRPLGDVRNLRVDVPPGLAANPEVLPKCTVEKFDANECGTSEQAGEDELEIYAEVFDFGHVFTLSAPVYDLEPPEPTSGSQGVPLDFGIHVNLSEDLTGIAFSPHVADFHLLLEGHVSWYREPNAQQRGVTSGDYHEWFTIANLPNSAEGIPIGIVKSKLIFYGNRAGSGFLTLPSECSEHVGGHLFVESYGSPPETSETFTTTPVGAEGCQNVPFKPEISLQPSEPTEGGSAQSDTPDGTTTQVTVPQNEGDAETEINSANPRQITLALPEGMSLNPSAAAGLQACSNAQFGIAAEGASLPVSPPTVEPVYQGGQWVPAPIACPAGSQIGTLAIETPDLPPGSLKGGVYLGEPLSNAPASGLRYRLLLSAESARFGVGARLVGTVSANPTTGQLAATVQTPQLPFGDATLRLRGGPQAPLANPLQCTEGDAEGSLEPYGGNKNGAFYPATASPMWPFQALGCAQPLSFAPSQSTADEPPQAGSGAAFTLNVFRADGQQYLSGLSTTLPEGLLGSIASVAVRCEEPQAASGACPSASRIGTVRTAIGAGSEPLEVPASNEAPGTVYLTGPYDNAPFGLVVVVPAEHIGPYDFGDIVVRATIELDPHTTRVTVTATQAFIVGANAIETSPTAVPTIVGGVPVRLRTLSVSLDRAGFITNPTSCSPLHTESRLTGLATLTATPVAEASDLASSPFQASGCGALGFSPTLSASTSNKTSRQDGASLQVTVTPGAHQADIRELAVTLPPQLVSRDSTLVRACSQAQFAINPAACPTGSQVATASLTTPLLPAPLTGDGYLVAEGGAAFPDLWFILSGDGITLVEEGHTAIKDGVTSSTFPELPDAPFSSFTATFPVGPYSLLSTSGPLCPHTVTSRTLVLVRKHGRPERKHAHRVYRTRVVTHLVPVSLTLPSTLVAQDGVRITRDPTISVAGCPQTASSKRLAVRLRVRRRRALITVTVSVPGRITVRGRDMAGTRHYAVHRGTVTFSAPLSRAGLHALSARRPSKIAVEVIFRGSGKTTDERASTKVGGRRR